MAELRSAEASLAALETSVATLRSVRDAPPAEDDNPAVEMVRETVRSVAQAVEGDVHATMAKFRARATTVDPVTNEPRFGPKTMARVTAMLAAYDALYEELTAHELLATAQRLVESADATRAREAARRHADEQQLARAREAEEREQRQRLVAKQTAQREREREAERQRVAELARIAQLKREERERQRIADEARARDEQARLARQNATAEVGLEGLKRAVEQLRRGMAGEPDAVARRPLEKLHELVANVCAAPDKAAFRHIPRDNEHFHDDIGRHNGGHACLLAMGFKELETEPGRRVFILEEPDLSEDLDQWSRWFDGLKEMKEWLEEQAKA